MNVSNCDNDPEVVYLGHTLMSRKEYEKKMKLDNEIKNCYVDFPGVNPWYDPPAYPLNPQQPVQPLIQPGFLPGLQSYPTTITVTALPSKWTRSESQTHVTHSIDLAGVKQSDINIYVDRGWLYVEAKRSDNGSLIREHVQLATADIIVDDVTAKFETCVLNISFAKRRQSRITIKVIE